MHAIPPTAASEILATSVARTAEQAAARADFERARRGAGRARRRPRLARPRACPGRLRHLDAPALAPRPARLRAIPLDAVVGTVDATTDFDAKFRPASDRVAPRWQRVATAHRAGRSLPPIAVLERPDGFYVLDGRHRVSVARALGEADILAWVRPAAAVDRAA